MRYKIYEKTFESNKKTLSPDTEKILNTMQNNYNGLFINTQNINNQNTTNSTKPENNSQNNMNSLFNSIGAGSGIEKFLPLFMLINKQNGSAQTQSANDNNNPNMKMFKLLSESGLFGNSISPDKLKLFELLMNMNKINNQTQKQDNHINTQNNLKNEQNNINEALNDTQEEDKINNLEKQENKNIRD